MFTSRVIKTFLAGAILGSFFVYLYFLRPIVSVLAAPELCEAGNVLKHKGSDDQISYSQPDGFSINYLCIFALTDSERGRVDDTNGVHTDALTSDGLYVRDCFQVDGLGTSTVSVTRTNENANCPRLFHLDINFVVPEENPSPTPTPTPSPTPEPVQTTTTTSDGGGGGTSDGQVAGVQTDGQVLGAQTGGQVLGASTLAEAGTTRYNLSLAFYVLGSVLSFLGLKLRPRISGFKLI